MVVSGPLVGGGGSYWASCGWVASDGTGTFPASMAEVLSEGAVLVLRLAGTAADVTDGPVGCSTAVVGTLES